MMIKTLFAKIHLWLAVPAGLIITVICLTGAILVFEEELLHLRFPDRYFVAKEYVGEPLPLHELIPIVNAQLDTNSVANVRIWADQQRTYAFGLKNGFRTTAYANPYTGEVTGVHVLRETFFFKMMALHRWLMDGTRTWGKQIVGVSTVLFIVILISGIIIWIPKNKKALKAHLSVQFKMGFKRFWRDLHISVGMYVSIFLLLSALTGLMWSYEGYRNQVVRLFGAEVQVQGGHGGQRSGGHSSQGGQGQGREVRNTPNALDVTHWQSVVATLVNQNQGFQNLRIQDGSASVLTKDAPHGRATDQYQFNTETGEIAASKLYAQTHDAGKIMGWVYALHVGDYWGVVGKILAFLASLIGASLPLTGYYMWYVRTKRARKNRTLLKV
jgi:uncharacterized iron-regulated membrane protein